MMDESHADNVTARRKRVVIAYRRGARRASDRSEQKFAITGQPARSRQWSYRDRRKELLLALLNQHGDELDNAIDELGRQLDHLRQVGIRGFIAEHTDDDDYARPTRPTNQPTRASTKNRTTRSGTGAAKPARTQTGASKKK
jgi:hypothetical protein